MYIMINQVYKMFLNSDLYLLIGYAISDQHDSLVAVCSNGSVPQTLPEQLERDGQCAGEVGYLLRFNLVDSLLELSDILVGSLDKLGHAIFASETFHKGCGTLAELVDGDKVVLAQGFQDVQDDMLRDLLSQSSHGSASVQQDHDLLGRRGRLDVPISHPCIVEVGLLLGDHPLHGGVLSHEARRGGEELPAEAGVAIVVVLEGPVQPLGPVDSIDHFGIAVKDIRWNMDNAHVGVDGDAGEVLVGLEGDAGEPDGESVVVFTSIGSRQISLPLCHVLVVVVLVQEVQLLGVDVVIAASTRRILEPMAKLFVVFVTQGKIFGKLHDSLQYNSQ